MDNVVLLSTYSMLTTDANHLLKEKKTVKSITFPVEETHRNHIIPRCKSIFRLALL